VFSAITKFRVVIIWNTLFIVIPEVTLNRLSETSYQCNIVVKGTCIWVVWEWGSCGKETMLLYIRIQSEKLKSFSELLLPYTYYIRLGPIGRRIRRVYIFSRTHLYHYIYFCVCMCVWAWYRFDAIVFSDTDFAIMYIW